MARKKKDGRRATGVTGKHGSLYVLIYEPVEKDGIIKNEQKWKPTSITVTN